MRVNPGVFVIMFAGQLYAGQAEEAFSLNERGLEAESRGNHGEAERLYREAIADWAQAGPEYAAHLATTQMNLGQALSAEGDRAAGARMLEDSWKGLQKALGPAHVRTITSQNMLAGVYLMLEQNDRAEALFNDALAVERAHFPEDIQLARTLGGLSCLRQRAGKVEEATPMAEEALRVAIAAAGDDSLDAALAYTNCAEIHRIAGRRERALPLYRKAQYIYERKFGLSHPRVASVLTQEALVLMDDGKLSLAEKDMLRSLAILSEECPNCVFERWVSESNLGLLRLKQGKYADADRLFSHVLALQEQHAGQPGADVAATLKSLAAVRQKEHRYEDADQLQKRAAAILSYQ